MRYRRLALFAPCLWRVLGFARCVLICVSEVLWSDLQMRPAADLLGIMLFMPRSPQRGHPCRWCKHWPWPPGWAPCRRLQAAPLLPALQTPGRLRQVTDGPRNRSRLPGSICRGYCMRPSSNRYDYASTMSRAAESVVSRLLDCRYANMCRSVRCRSLTSSVCCLCCCRHRGDGSSCSRDRRSPRADKRQRASADCADAQPPGERDARRDPGRYARCCRRGGVRGTDLPAAVAGTVVARSAGFR